MIDWVDIRQHYPTSNILLTTDGLNVVIQEYRSGIFYPIRLIRGFTENIIPKYWYNLNDVRLPEE